MARQAPNKGLATGNNIWRRTSRTIPRMIDPKYAVLQLARTLLRLPPGMALSILPFLSQMYS